MLCVNNSITMIDLFMGYSLDQGFPAVSLAYRWMKFIYFNVTPVAACLTEIKNLKLETGRERGQVI